MISFHQNVSGVPCLYLHLIGGVARRPPPLTAATSTPQRAPLGTPLRVPPNTPFSHIQVIPKISPKAKDKDSTLPMFRKTSLSYEVEGKDDNTALVSGGVESLADNSNGPTFASKARAAELVASRSRSVLSAEKQPGEPSTPLESMKFTKPRIRPVKAWKPLDIANLMEAVSSDLSQNNDDSMKVHNGHAYYDESTVQHVFDDRSTDENLQPHNFPRLSGTSHPEPALSPDSKALAQSVDDYNASEWDPDMPSTFANNNRSPSQAFGSEVSREDSSANLEVPGMNTPSRSNPHTSIKSVRPSYYSTTAVAETLDDDNHIRETKLTGIRVLTPTVLNRFRTDGKKDFVVDDPFADTSQSHHSFTFPNISHDRSPDEYTLARHLTHKYPAVKGTMDHKFQLPLEHSTRFSAHSQQQSNGQASRHQVPYSPYVNFQPGITAYEQTAPYRRLSAEDKKDMLEQLNNIVEQQAGIQSATRTVLHDPIASADTAPLVATLSPDAKVSRLETEFVKQSDPLPWRTRPVDVVPTPSMSNAELAVMSSSRSEPSLRSNRSTSTEAVKPPPFDETIAEAEAWFRTDNRMNAHSQEVFSKFLSQATITHREAQRALMMEAALKAARRRAVTPEGWYDNNLSPVIPRSLEKPDDAHTLMVPVLANLAVYLDPATYFGRFGPAPEWCIDQGPNGNNSFFGKGWGTPPPRVGRDPRYRGFLHEGRYTLPEDAGLRGMSSGFGRRMR